MQQPSSSPDQVMLQNPNTGRDDVRIAADIYEPVRAAILDAIADSGRLRLSDLRAEVEGRTPAEIWNESSVGWYTTAVKLDLEAKGLILTEGSPQVLSLGQAAT